MFWGTRESDWNEFPWHERRSPDIDWDAHVAIGRNAQPFWWPFNYALQPQVTLDSSVAPSGSFVALKLMSASSQAKGFRTQLRQTVDERGAGCSLSKVGIEQANFAGAFGGNNLPLLLLSPLFVPTLKSILNRCANKSISTDPAAGVNTVQIVIQGVRTSE